MTYLALALRHDPALQAEFRKLCTPDALSGDVRTALKSHPSFADVFLPHKLDALRRLYDCPARRGGLRPAGKPFYKVYTKHARA